MSNRSNYSVRKFRMNRHSYSMLGGTLAFLIFAACSSSPAPKSAETEQKSDTARASATSEVELSAAKKSSESSSERAANDGSIEEGAASMSSAVDRDGPPKNNPKSDNLPLKEFPKDLFIVHIGDSFAQALGSDMKKQLSDQGVKCQLKTRTPSYIPEWASNGDLEKLLSTYHPQLVIVSLGANDLEVPNLEERGQRVKKLVGKLGKTACIWIAPALWEGAKEDLLAVIKEQSAPCLYLDPRDIMPSMPRAKDGVHPLEEIRAEWAKLTIDWIRQHLLPQNSIESPEPWIEQRSANP